MEKIKLQETKKSCRSLLRNNKSILFDITKEMYLKYFCENLKDIIIVEKLLLILEALIKSQNLIIHKKEDIKSNKTKIENELTTDNKEIGVRGRKSTKEIRHTEIDLVCGGKINDKKLENGRYDSKIKDRSEKKRDLSVSDFSDKKISKKKRKKVLYNSLSKSNYSDIENIEPIKSNDYSVSNIDNKNQLNSKKKRRKTKKKNKIDVKHNTGNLSEDKSYISDDNVEKNKLNFFQVLKNVTTNMLLESKIKGENVRCVVEPEVIPDLDKILAEPENKTQRNNYDFNKYINKNMSFSNDDYDYNSISDRSNIYVNNQRNKDLLSKKLDYKEDNVFKKSQKSIDSKDNKKESSKIKENEANKSVIINIKREEEKYNISDRKANVDNNIPPTDRSGIYRLNDISNHDLSKENRLEFVSTNDKNEFKKKGHEIYQKSDIAKETNNLVIKIDENIPETVKDIEVNNRSYEIRNEDIVLNEKIRRKKSNEIDSLGLKSKKTSDKPLKIENQNNITKKRKNNDGCKCACSIF